MRQLVYLSRASRDFGSEDLARIVSRARLNNRQLYVTGLLLFAAGRFLQALEGDPSNVGLIFDKIRADRRHDGISILRDRTVASREFGTWAMAANDDVEANFVNKARALVSGATCPVVRAKFANFVDYV